ncbi:glycosyltransferase [Arthrobacter oryzae]|uniref:glycosyltransferase n=1 Tax=Arthrobacter oryzae TaxID=409290 RepID=UPI00352F67BC
MKDVPMKVLIMTLGTRGDVQPFIALARGLMAAGHEVVLTAPQRFEGSLPAKACRSRAWTTARCG